MNTKKSNLLNWRNKRTVETADPKAKVVLSDDTFVDFSELSTDPELDEVKRSVSAIEAKIPTEASSQNLLADKDFVNEGIATASADFKGTYNSLQELELVVANKNDYAYVISRVKDPSSTIFSMDFAAQETQLISAEGFLGEVFFKSQTTVTNGFGFEFQSDPSQSGQYIAIPLSGIIEELVVKVTFGANKKHNISYWLVSGEEIISPTVVPESFEQGKKLTENSTIYILYIKNIPLQNNYGVLYLGRRGADSKNFRSVIVKTLQASNVSYDRYKWTDDGWEYEYSIDRDGFSDSQWAAINSGIDEYNVDKLNALPTKVELDASLDAKADKSEMSVSTNADKTTITLKTGTSAEVINAHQDISGKVDVSDFEDTELVIANALVDLDERINGLATVASTGDYNDLDNKPTIPTVPTNVSAFTNDAGYLTQHQSLADYVQFNDLASVATSGDYDDLSNKPTLFSGDYNDLTNKPTIPTVPTNVSAFTNDAGYLTLHLDISGKVDVADFEEAEEVAAEALVDLDARVAALEQAIEALTNNA